MYGQIHTAEVSLPTSPFSLCSFRKRERTRKRSAAVLVVSSFLFVFQLTCLMGVDSRSQSATTKWKEKGRGQCCWCWGTEIDCSCWRRGFLNRREPFNPCWASRLQKTGVGEDGWLRVQSMTGHPSYYRCPAFPDGVKEERMGRQRWKKKVKIF